VSDQWAHFIDVNLNAAFRQMNADKKFLSLTAQKGVFAASEVSPIPQTSNVLVKQCSSKIMVLAEFACRSLEILIKAAPP